jgi:hypothetical protein
MRKISLDPLKAIRCLSSHIAANDAQSVFAMTLACMFRCVRVTMRLHGFANC